MENEKRVHHIVFLHSGSVRKNFLTMRYPCVGLVTIYQLSKVCDVVGV